MKKNSPIVLFTCIYTIVTFKFNTVISMGIEHTILPLKLLFPSECVLKFSSKNLQVSNTVSNMGIELTTLKQKQTVHTIRLWIPE